MPVKWFIKTPEKSQWSPLMSSYTKTCTTLTGSRFIKNHVCKSNYQEPAKDWMNQKTQSQMARRSSKKEKPLKIKMKEEEKRQRRTRE